MASVAEIKEKFNKNPKRLVKFLEYWFSNVKIHKNYISFGRDEDGSPKGLTLYFDEKNPKLFVQDYSRGISSELFSYLIEHKHETFRELMIKASDILGLEIKGTYRKPKARSIFTEFYKNCMTRNRKPQIQTFDDSIMDQFWDAGNERFSKDGIDYRTQKEFDVRFSVRDNAIVFPIRNEVGEIIGVKARVNEDHPVGSKYFHIEPAPMSTTLYGYSHNYSDLFQGTVYVFEAEKSVMQMHSMGKHNAVAIGSSILSRKQADLLLSLDPKKIILCHDQGLKEDVVINNAKKIYSKASMKELKISYIDMETAQLCLGFDDKSSPSDMGKEVFEDLIKDYQVPVERN